MIGQCIHVIKLILLIIINIISDLQKYHMQVQDGVSRVFYSILKEEMVLAIYNLLYK